MVPSCGLMCFPMKVEEGWGCREDLELMRNPAERSRWSAESTVVVRVAGEGPMKEMSSRYWMVCDASSADGDGGKEQRWRCTTLCAKAGAWVQPKGRESRV